MEFSTEACCTHVVVRCPSRALPPAAARLAVGAGALAGAGVRTDALAGAGVRTHAGIRVALPGDAAGTDAGLDPGTGVARQQPWSQYCNVVGADGNAGAVGSDPHRNAEPGTAVPPQP